MNRSVAALAGCIGALIVTAALAQTEPAASPLRSFDWTYHAMPEPGNRHWTSPDGVNWTEVWPSGSVHSQKTVAIAEIGGCNGVITEKVESPEAQTFIPNPGCPTMAVLFRFSGEAWRPLGLIESYSTQLGGAQIVAVAPLVRKVRATAGSGIFVNADGVVLINAHVANGCRVLLVKAYDATPTAGVLEAVDPKNDLALVRTHAGYGEPAVFRAQRKAARLGETVGVVGYPLVGVLSSEPKATFGEVNSLAGANNDYTLLQISAPIQPGNSGGPVFDESGLVIGVVVATTSPALIAKIGAIPQNVNFAIRGEIAQIFMTAHGVNFKTQAAAHRLETEDIAEAGEKSTAQILCLKSQVAP